MRTGPWDLAASGDVGDSRIVTLTLEDVDADLENPAGWRFALPGNFVNDFQNMLIKTHQPFHTPSGLHLW